MTAPLVVSPLAVTLRDYQTAAIDAVYSWLGEKSGNPLVVVPTGGGKSLIIAGFVHSVLSQWPSERILILTHVKELIAQNHAQMLRCWPGAPAGIYSAGIGKREHDAHVLFAGIQSVHNKVAKIGWADIVIIDEAHLVPKKGLGMYRAFLDGLLSMNPKLRVVGLTATPFRTDSGSLDGGKDRLFHGVAYDCDLLRLIEDGYLSPVISKGTKATIDTTSVHRQAGEFVAKELEHAAMEGDIVPRAVREVVERGHDRKSWLLFCCGVHHARSVADELDGHGVKCATVFGTTPPGERDRIVAEFRAGTIRAVVNVNVLTTGFDAPQTDLIALLRPTCSPGLYVQMVGRGLRRAEGKKDCLVLDFGSNVLRHGPLNNVRPREPGEKAGQGAVMARECPNCQTLVAIQVRVCPECEFEWAVLDDAGPRHAEIPGDAPILVAPGPAIDKWDVEHVTYEEWEKPRKPLSMCVSYLSGLRRVREWICFEHDGYAKVKAGQWWVARGGNLPVPATVQEALVRQESGELRPVLGVTVDMRGEYPELRGVRLGHNDAGLHEFDGPVAVDGSLEDIPF